MYIEETRIKLKDGREARLRSPTVDDAQTIIDYLIQASGETHFLMRYPEEWSGLTLEFEQQLLQNSIDNPDGAMIGCFVDGKAVANCMININNTIKTKHRASVAIAVLKDYWNQGIGTQLFNALFEIAKSKGVQQIELDFIEGNNRARALYEKLGFRITGVKYDATKLKDGTLLNEYMMIKKL